MPSRRPFAVSPATRVLVCCPSCKGSGVLEMRGLRAAPKKGSATATVEDGIRVPCSLCDGDRVYWAQPASMILFQDKVLPGGWVNALYESADYPHTPPLRFKWVNWVEHLHNDRVVVYKHSVRIVGVGQKCPKWTVHYWNEKKGKWVKVLADKSYCKSRSWKDVFRSWKTLSFETALKRAEEIYEQIQVEGVD